MDQRRRRLVIAGLLLAALLAPLAVSHAQTPITPAPIGAAVEDGAVPEIPSRNMFDILRAGGVLMIPIIFCSMFTLVILFERLIALRSRRVIPRAFVKRLVAGIRDGSLDREEARERCDENPSPVAQVLGAAVRKWGRPSVEVEQALLDEGERAAVGLRRNVRAFNGVATISPLLGLLGTVFGMITAFNDIASSDAMGRPELLAAGISEALITTAAGLIVAIPSLACYLYFISRVDSLVVEIDALGKQVVELISAEGLSERTPTRGRGKREAA